MKLVGERRALAAVIMAFYFLAYGVLAVSRMAPDMTRALAAIAGVYGLAFFALVAGYFWARWFAVGVGLYGVITSAVGIWQLGAEPVLLFVGGTHLAATLFLWGHAMSEPYDGQTAWREKFHMDDSAVQRLGRSVIRAGIGLPIVLIYAFAPRPDAASAALLLAAVTLAGFGLRGLVQLRTWGVLALGVAGALTLGLFGADIVAHGAGAVVPHVPVAGGAVMAAFTAPLLAAPALAAIAGVALLAAAVPFLAPIARFLRR